MKRCYLLLIALACSSIAIAQKEINKTFSGIKEIRVNTASGDCKLKKGSGSDVQVNLVYTYDDDRFKPIMEKEGNTLIIKEDFARGSNSGRSTWTLTIPDNLELDFNTGSGNLIAENLSVALKSNLGSGNFDLNNINGRLKVNTGSGNISMNQVKGEIDGNSGSGNIEITGAEGEIGLNSGSGTIRLSGAKGKLSANVGSGNVKADAITLTGRGSFNSGSGNVTIKLAASPDYNISVNSGSGDATLDFAGNKIEGTVVMTVNKRNGDIIAPFPFDKTEEIDDDGNQVRIRKTAKLGSKDVEIRIGSGSGTAEIKK